MATNQKFLACLVLTKCPIDVHWGVRHQQHAPTALTSVFSSCAFHFSVLSVEALNPNSVDLNKTDDEEETQKDEFVHTPDDYVTTDDETHDVDDKEYDRISKEMYDDVNVDLKDVELVDEGKGDKEMTDAEKLNAELKEVNQEVAKKEVKILKNVKHNLAIRAAIKFEVPIVVKEYLGTNLEDSFHKVIQIQTADFIHEHTIPVAVVTDDKDVMNKGVADKLKKRKPYDVDRDEDPHAGSD
ncbi:hypothetical protein Tco_0524861 [Tanacetum coccineum]